MNQSDASTSQPMPETRRPYVGEGSDGARRSAQIDRDEADGLEPGSHRDAVLRSAARWDEQADMVAELERRWQDEKADEALAATLDQAAGVLQRKIDEAAAAEGEVLDPVRDETPRERAARRLLGIAALEKLLKAEKDALRAEEGAAFTKAGQREVAELDDGTPLGNVRLDPVAGGWKLESGGLWLNYCRAMRPDQVEETVSYSVYPAYTAATKAQLEAGEGEWFAETTGEQIDVPPGWVKVPAGTRLVVTADKGAPAAIRRQLGRLGSLLGLREIEQ